MSSTAIIVESSAAGRALMERRDPVWPFAVIAVGLGLTVAWSLFLAWLLYQIAFRLLG